jgi:hypothetical protein
MIGPGTAIDAATVASELFFVHIQDFSGRSMIGMY